jgi:hypothetical protein
MKYNTTMILDGKTIDVMIEANTLQEAKILIKQKYKNSQVIGVCVIPPYKND